MTRPSLHRTAIAACLLASVAGGGKAQSGDYPRANIGAYLEADQHEEVKLAASAAPPTLAGRADLLVLGAAGYELMRKGDNGFVCLVERSWSNPVSSPEFWNPKIRVPICYNQTASLSVLAAYLKRTERIMAGEAAPAIEAVTREEIASGQIIAPAAGALAFMLSRHGYLDDGQKGPWRPHMVIYYPRMEAAVLGANLGNSMMIAQEGGNELYTILIVPTINWSDGSAPPSGI